MDINARIEAHTDEQYLTAEEVMHDDMRRNLKVMFRIVHPVNSELIAMMRAAEHR